MIRLSVLQMQWLMLGLAGGLAMVFLIVLTYLMIWRPRLRDAQGQIVTARGWRAAWAFIPWALIVIYVATIVYGLMYAIACMLHPPTTW
jgi:hypothetical protein